MEHRSERYVTPAQLCSEPFCTQLALSRDGYCAEHQRQVLARDLDRTRDLDDDGWCA